MHVLKTVILAYVAMFPMAMIATLFCGYGESVQKERADAFVEEGDRRMKGGNADLALRSYLEGTSIVRGQLHAVDQTYVSRLSRAYAKLGQEGKERTVLEAAYQGDKARHYRDTVSKAA